MDSATKSAEHANELTISPDWKFTRSRLMDGTTFAFHSSKTCPGYSIQISNWRLRKVAHPIGGHSTDIDDLALGIRDELERVLGKTAFEKSNRVQSDLLKEASQTPGLFRQTGLLAEKYLGLQDKFTIALMEDLWSPQVALLSVPLSVLTVRNKTPYVIEKVPWSFRTPPCRLQHFATTGFNSRIGRGIVACVPGSEDVWIVSSFSQCEVEPSCDRSAEFTGINDLVQSITAEVMKVLKAVPQKPATDNGKTIQQPPEKLELAAALLWAILEKIAVHDAKATARPTPSEFFRAYMIDKLTSKAMKLRGWRERTLRNRRQLAETVIAECYGSKVSLRKFRDIVDPRIFRAAEQQIEAARKHGRKAFL